MTSCNKLLTQQIKTFIQSLSQPELDKLIDCFEKAVHQTFTKSNHLVSYKCYEAKILWGKIEASGFGRDQNEALSNSIKSFFDNVLESELYLQKVKDCFKRIKETQEETKQQATTVTTVVNPIKICNAENTSILNNSALNCSSIPPQDSMDIEALSKKIGNISMINNPNNNSQNEIEETLLKFMQDEEKLQTKNTSPITNNKLITLKQINNEIDQFSAPNDGTSQQQSKFSKNKVTQNPPPQKDTNNYRMINPNIITSQKQLATTIQSSASTTPQVTAEKKQIQSTTDQIELQKSEKSSINQQSTGFQNPTNNNKVDNQQQLTQDQVNHNINKELQNKLDLQKSSIEKQPINQVNNRYQKSNISDEKENQSHSINTFTVQSKFQPSFQKQYGFEKEQKELVVEGALEEASNKKSPINSQKSHRQQLNPQQCYLECKDKSNMRFCIHEEELKREKMKVEHLEKRIKLIVEENKILKSLLLDKAQNQDSQNKNIINNTLIAEGQNQNNQKSIHQYQTIQDQRYKPNSDNFEPPQKDVVIEQKTESNRNVDSVNGRSSSVDPKRNYRTMTQTTSNQRANSNSSNMNTSLLNTSTTSNKKHSIPKLNLEVLPNYHGKATKSLNNYLLNIYCQNHDYKD